MHAIELPAAIAALPLLIGLALGVAADAQERERTFCDDSDPTNHCPGEDCACVDDTLEIVFEGDLTNSVFEYGEFPTEGLRVPSVMTAQVVSDQIRGFSFGVTHDPAVLSLVARDLVLVGTTAWEFCTVCEARPRVVANGFIIAMVFNFSLPVVLPVGRATLVRPTYTLLRDVGSPGTVLSFSEALGNPASQIVLTIDLLSFPDMVDRGERNCINRTDDDGDGLTDRDDPDCVVRNGVSRQPRRLIDGLIRRRAVAAAAPFRRGDADGNGKLNITDAILVIQVVLGNLEPSFRCDDLLDTTDDGRLDMTDGVALLRHIFQDSPTLLPPFLDCGEDPTSEALACAQSNCQPP